MVNKLGIKPLQNAEFIQFLTQFLAVITDNFTGSITMPSVLQAVKANAEKVLTELNAAHKGDPASALTDSLLAADAERDSLYIGMSQICRACQRHPDAEVRGAAHLLVRSLEVYGGSAVAEQTQNAETATLNSLLTDWSTKPELSGAATVLKLGAWTAALQTANNQFNDLFLQRSKETSGKLPYTMKEKRAEAIAAYDTLVKKLNGFYEVSEGAAPWDNLPAQLNAVSDKYRTLLAARQGQKEETPTKPA